MYTHRNIIYTDNVVRLLCLHLIQLIFTFFYGTSVVTDFIKFIVVCKIKQNLRIVSLVCWSVNVKVLMVKKVCMLHVYRRPVMVVEFYLPDIVRFTILAHKLYTISNGL